MDKQKQIVKMFDEIASSYDLANRVLSFGVDVKWRKEGCFKALARLKDTSSLVVADVACGTGDMILHWQHYLPHLTKFIGIDPSSKMLEEAQKKLLGVEFLQAQAQQIPLEDDSVDIVSIAYGLRNVCDYGLALQEFYRILKPGGVLLVLEFTRNPHPTLFERCARFYTQKILPILGGMISRNYQAYQYLPDSIEGFICSEELQKILVEVGFTDVEVKSYSAKLSSLFLATKE